MRILVIDRAPPWDLLQGNALIGRHLFSRLRQQHHLTLVCPAPSREIESYRESLSELFDTIYLVPRERPIAALMGLLEPLLARSGLSLGGRVDVAAVRAFQQQVARVLNSDTFDVVHARQLPMAAVVTGLDHPCKLLELIDSETLQSVRRVRAKSPKTWLRYLSARALEQQAVRRFDACTTVADADAQMVRRLAPRLPVHVVPNGVDADHFAPLERAELPGTLIFTGAMSFPPNVTAVLHFYENIMPLVRRELPDARLIIAGRDPAPAVAALAADPQVTVTGFVEDMRPWLAESCVMVCPMLTGSGIKNKVLEALAMARPVVSTTLGIEALEVADGRELRIADTPADFAAAVLELLRDRDARRRLGQAGRARVLQRYTWDACAASYEELYGQLVARRRSVAQVTV
jgi:sugar transferase (PEP-CTERM/EpsH1 system associated)